MDMTKTIEPRSDQLNADDLITGPITVTITGVTRGNPEQPVNVELAEHPGRPYKPSKSMRRVMVAAWGKDSTAYTGQSLTLYRNPEIRFGKEKVGGIEISHMTGLDKPLLLSLTVSRGKKKAHTVQPLTVEPPANDITGLIADATTVEELRGLWEQADQNQRAIIQTRVAQINQETAGEQA